MTLQDIEQAIYRRTGYSDYPPQDVQRRVRGYINEWHRRILSLPGLTKLRDSTERLTIMSVAGQSHYSLGPTVARVLNITDRQNDLKLLPQSLDWYRTQEPDPTGIQGVPDYYIPIGFRPVMVQPQRTGLWVLSSSVTDTGTVFLEGVRGLGVTQTESVILSGTTTVQAGVFSDYLSVEKFYLSAPQTGTVMLVSDAAASVELGRILPGTTMMRHFTIILFPTPSGAVPYHIDYTRQILDLVNPTDEPLLPQDFHHLLVLAGRADEYERKDDTRSGDAKAELAGGIVMLRHYVENPPGYFIVPGEDVTGGRSNLGPWFPRGRW
jgi:hypothetical protein